MHNNKMGGNNSTTNVTNITQETVANETQNITQDAVLTANQNQVINITATDDIIFSGNYFDQSASISMSSMMTALTTAEASQSMSAQMEQEAKSAMSGINLGVTNNKASNKVSASLSAQMNITNNIGQNCTTISNLNQEVNLNSQDGTVVFTNNSFSQVANLFSDCVQNASASATAVQDLSTAVSQSAVAETKGLNPKSPAPEDQRRPIS